MSGKGLIRFKYEPEVQEALSGFINTIDDIYTVLGLKLSYEENQKVKKIQKAKQMEEKMNNTLLDKTEAEVLSEKRAQVYAEQRQSASELIDRIVTLSAFIEFHGLWHNFEDFKKEAKKR